MLESNVDVRNVDYILDVCNTNVVHFAQTLC